MSPAELFRASLSLIDEVSAGVCRRARVFGADAEDFTSSVKLALLEDDYAILRKYQGRASLKTYLTVVADRLLSDMRTHEYGRWRPSAEATRLGPAALVLEALVHRDGRLLDEALPHVSMVDATLTRERAEEILGRLPGPRRRPVRVEIDTLPEDTFEAPGRADTRLVEREASELSRETSRVVRKAIAALPLEDRMLLRFRYASSMNISDISRIMRLPQRPLYRRFEALLAQLRHELKAAGLDARDVEALIGSDHEQPVDFFSGLENGPVCQSLSNEEPQKAAGESP